MKALVGLGSNLEPRRHLAEAARRLERDSEVLAWSRTWWTPAVGGPPGNPPFLNAVALLQTPRRPVALRRWLQGIEHEHGRVRTHDRSAPRTLDLDTLALERGEADAVGWEWFEDVARQPFMLLPLRDVVPRLVLPDGRSVAEAANDTPLPGARVLGGDPTSPLPEGVPLAR